MISRYTKRKRLSKINFELALSTSSSQTSKLAASPSGCKFGKPNPPLDPQAEDGCNLHPPNDHSAPCSVDPGNPGYENASTPPLEEPHVELCDDMSPPDFHDPNRHHRKKDSQYRHWQNEVIPALIQPYLDILRQTDHMRLPLPEAPLSECQCGLGRRPLKVLGVSWTSE
jgi:hypothetical protein